MSEAGDDKGPVTTAELRSAAIDRLARREHSRQELARKLRTRFRARAPDEALIDEVLSSLAENGLQSDGRCAEAMVHARINRGQGPLKIRAALREIGLDAALFEPLLEAVEDDWPEHLSALCRRRFGDAPAADRRDWSRRARFLASRGFPESMVVRALGTPPHA